MTDSVVIQSEDAGEPEGHTQKMIDLADGVASPETPAEAPTEERPDWLPEQFNTVEEFTKAYEELAATKAESDKQAAIKQASETTEEEARADLAERGLDITEFANEFYANESLSEESYAKLEQAGISRELVDAYIAGQEAVREKYQDALLSEVGGSEKYSIMTDWAKANFSVAEIDSYNNVVSSGDKEAAKLAVLGLAARYEAATGKEPKLLGGSPSAGSSDVFESVAQLTEAMSDPKYAADEAYRAKVVAKLKRSNIM